MRNLGNIKVITGAELAVVLADNTQFTIDSEHISMNGIVLDDSTSVDGQFTIGAAVTGQLTITILNEDELYSPYNFRDATCQLTLLGVDEIPDDEEEMEEDSIIIGQYNIVDYTYDGSDITLTAYDNLSKFDFPCTETRGETITFPMTLTALVQTAARICQVTLASQLSPIPNGSYSVAQQPEGWDTMTWHDVIAYCAQLGGVYAKVDKYGRVFFDWYNINAIPEGYDGGTFDTTTTPYSDGDELDGGDFSYDGSEDSADGGTFTYPADMHFIDSPYSLTIDTDDVYISGLKVILEVANNINADENTQDYTTALYGTDGYVITISGNPFIQTTAQADAIKDFLGAVAVGMWFRPLSATIDDDLSIESGDQAYINGVNGNTYQCFVSHVTYTTNAGTVIACDAEANSASEKTRFTAADKLASHVATIQKRLDGVSTIAGNTNQYFWHRETGTDTGAHVTEVNQEEWDDPNSQNYHSGGNLLIRSNGLAVRDGLAELASMSGDGIQIGQDNGFRAMVNDDSIELMDDKGASGFRISLDGNTTQRTIQNTYVMHSNQRPNITFSAPISSYTLSFRAAIGSNVYTVTKTSEQLPVNQTFNLGVNSSSGYIRVTRTGANAFKAVYVDATSRGSTLQVSYTVSFDMAKINFNGGNNILWQGGSYMNASQTASLSESISEQLSGIVLVWSAYFEGASQNYDWYYQFVAKDHALRSEVGGVTSGMMVSAFQNGTAYLGMKYVLVSNDIISGHELNGRSSMSVGGATLTNTHWVLRYVLGV